METTHKCETCSMRLNAEAKPKSFMAKFWRWHTTWCPGWKDYQRYLKAKQAEAPPAK